MDLSDIVEFSRTSSFVDCTVMDFAKNFDNCGMITPRMVGCCNSTIIPFLSDCTKVSLLAALHSHIKLTVGRMPPLCRITLYGF